MMRVAQIAFLCKMLGTVALALASQPAIAQLSGDTPGYVSASYAARLSRYYAPYALQAAAAYVDVKSFDATRGPANEPPLDGSDVQLAVSSYSQDSDIMKRATKYLQSWQYQFGSEGYLTCFEADLDCLKAIRNDRWTVATSDGPAFHVWARTRFPHKQGAACSEVSIAFRGTILSVSDWTSNLDPVTGYFTDNSYRQLRRNIDPILKKVTSLDCYRRSRTRPQIVSVGHSLGGGLAQMAALANNPARPRINKVIAFDPSPVTGASYIDKNILAQNVDGLEIDRVYQSGEVLQRLRKYYQQPPKSSSPCVRNVKYDFFQEAGSVVLHNMSGLAREMVRSSYDGEAQYAYEVPRRLPKCETRYRSPNSDQDPMEQPDMSNPLLSRKDVSAWKVAGENRDDTSNNYFAPRPWQSTTSAFAAAGDVREIVRIRHLRAASMNRAIARERAHSKLIARL